MKILKQPLQRRRHEKELRPIANSHAREPSCKWVTHPQSSFQMMAAPADGLTITSWELLIQNHLPRLFPGSWPSEIVLENVRCFMSLNFGLSSYASIDNWHNHVYLSDLIFQYFLIMLPQHLPAYSAWNPYQSCSWPRPGPQWYLWLTLCYLGSSHAWLLPVMQNLVFNDYSL